MTKTKIPWAERVWNPVTGCTKVSAGCDNCYAETMSKRFGWTRDVVLRPDRIDQPTRWKKPAVIFVCSMGDLFHEEVPFAFIDQVYGTMVAASQHTFIVLTKRPERAKACMEFFGERCDGGALPVPNVWLGVSIEDQETAAERVPIILDTPAAVRLVSVEPMLDYIDLTRIDTGDAIINALDGSIGVEGRGWTGCARLNWIICGAESGPRRRAIAVNAIQLLRDQSYGAHVPFFLKQMEVDGKLVKMPALDGRVWDQRPEVAE